MASQNPILCDQVLVAEQQILIHQPCYERQEVSQWNRSRMAERPS
jgi:hypothetical protein